MTPPLAGAVGLPSILPRARPRRAKKERRSSAPRLFSMGTAAPAAGLGGDVRFVVQPRGWVLVRGRADAVLLAQPAPEVDQLAAGAAERVVRPFRRPPVHRPLTDRALHLYHRKLTSRTWNFSPHPFSLSCLLWRLPRRIYRRRRPRLRCRYSPWSRPAPPWPTACMSRCGSRSGRTLTP